MQSSQFALFGACPLGERCPAGVYVEEGPDRDALTEALARENYLPVYLDPRTVPIMLAHASQTDQTAL